MNFGINLMIFEEFLIDSFNFSANCKIGVRLQTAVSPRLLNLLCNLPFWWILELIWWLLMIFWWILNFFCWFCKFYRNRATVSKKIFFEQYNSWSRYWFSLRNAKPRRLAIDFHLWRRNQRFSGFKRGSSQRVHVSCSCWVLKVQSS